MNLYRKLLTVSEINREFKKIVPQENIFLLGKSSNGREIFGAKIGIGKKNALVYGFPHPNEAVGALTALQLIKEILNSSDLQNKYTWYIIPCVDPDGAKLNQEWFKNKLNINIYINNFFRQAMGRQVEWSFPFKYKNYSFNRPTKETRLLVRLIDKTKPSFICPLHNSGIGGVFWYVTKTMPQGYYQSLITTCRKLGLPIARAKSEGAHMEEIRGPFFYCADALKLNNNFKKKENQKKILPYGNDSIGYARTKNKNAFGLIIEAPYFIDNKISNKRKLKVTKEELQSKRKSIESDIYNFMENIFNSYQLNKKSVLYKEIRAFLADRNQGICGAQSKKSSRVRATVADKYASEVVSRFYSVVWLGMLKRLIKESGRSKEMPAALGLTNRKISEIIKIINQKSKFKTAPVSGLVELQLKSILKSVKYLK